MASISISFTRSQPVCSLLKHLPINPPTTGNSLNTLKNCFLSSSPSKSQRISTINIKICPFKKNSMELVLSSLCRLKWPASTRSLKRKHRIVKNIILKNKYLKCSIHSNHQLNHSNSHPACCIPTSKSQTLKT